MADTFIRGANPIWWLPDLIGQPLNDEYYAFFLENELPYLPQNVYQDPLGEIPWANPLQFQPSGTLPNNLYFNGDLTYRIEIRRGNSQSDELVWLIENYMPSESGGEDTTSNFGGENLVTNPQFANVNFTSPLNIAGDATVEVAPGWTLTLIGALGTATINQVIIPGNQQQVNDPPFALEINTANYTEAFLTQRFSGNGALFASTTVPGEQIGAVSMSLTATTTAASYDLSMFYIPSSATIPGGTLVASGSVNLAGYSVVQGIVEIPPSTNPNLGFNSYVDLQINLQPDGDVTLTNIQFVGESLPEGTLLPSPAIYKQEPIERQDDHTFHVYKNSLLMQPKKSLLTAWNFSLNPFQFISPAITGMGAQLAQYQADQTIVQQESASVIETGQATNAAYRQGFQVQAVDSTSDNRFALIQYIDPSTVRPYWSYVLSALVRLQLVSPNGNTIRFKCSLIYRTDLPDAIATTPPITTWDANGVSFDPDWTEVKPLNDPTYTLSNDTSAVFPEFSFDQFQLPDASTANMTLGIVIYTLDDLDSTPGTKDFIVFDKVSLVQNDFAIDTPPQTFDEVLRECQFYYEKSYSKGVLPGSVTYTGSLVRRMHEFNSGGFAGGYASPFQFEYNTIKRKTTSIVFLYTPNIGTAGQIHATLFRNGLAIANIDRNLNNPSGFWATANISDKSVFYDTITPFDTPMVGGSGPATAADNTSCVIYFHYTIQARLGIAGET